MIVLNNTYIITVSWEGLLCVPDGYLFTTATFGRACQTMYHPYV